jgi:hypothetical protein
VIDEFIARQIPLTARTDEELPIPSGVSGRGRNRFGRPYEAGAEPGAVSSALLLHA